MNNPWTEINLDDYEKHMSLENIYQLQTLNEMMCEQLGSYGGETIMILGVAGGNGLEHIDQNKFRLVYGVDINQSYLDECSKRYSALGSRFVPICADLTDNVSVLPCSDMLIANLLIEYIGYDCFRRVVKQVKSGFVSCIIQINTETAFVSDSPYIHAFDRLCEVHCRTEENQLAKCMEEIGYKRALTDERVLPNGKKLLRIDFLGKGKVQ